jgi:hypothetical protein
MDQLRQAPVLLKDIPYTVESSPYPGCLVLTLIHRQFKDISLLDDRFFAGGVWQNSSSGRKFPVEGTTSVALKSLLGSRSI